MHEDPFPMTSRNLWYNCMHWLSFFFFAYNCSRSPLFDLRRVGESIFNLHFFVIVSLRLVLKSSKLSEVFFCTRIFGRFTNKIFLRNSKVCYKSHNINFIKGILWELNVIIYTVTDKIKKCNADFYFYFITLVTRQIIRQLTK